jgi:acyl transferase domain-containing protein
MAAVGLGVEKVEPYISGLESDVKIAAINSPQSVTLSGEVCSISQILEQLEAEKIFARALKTGGNAYHSHHMAALGECYETMVAQGFQEISEDIAMETRIQSSKVWISSVNPYKVISKAAIGPSYWRQNLEKPVLFADAIGAMMKQETISLDLLVEIGPHPALGGIINQIRAKREADGLEMPPHFASLSRGRDGLLSMLELAGNLFIKNVGINLAAVNAVDQFRHGKLQLAHGSVLPDLPGYEYHYGPIIFHENRFNREWRLRKHLRHDLLGARQPGGSKFRPSWRNMLRMKDVPWLDDHKVGHFYPDNTSSYGHDLT